MFQQSAAAAKSNYETTLITNYANSSNPAIYHYIRSFTKSATIPPTIHLDATSANSNISRVNFLINISIRFLLHLLQLHIMRMQLHILMK